MILFLGALALLVTVDHGWNKHKKQLRLRAEQRIQTGARRKAELEAPREQRGFEESHEVKPHITKTSALAPPGFEIDHSVVIGIMSSTSHIQKFIGMLILSSCQSS